VVDRTVAEGAYISEIHQFLGYPISAWPEIDWNRTGHRVCVAKTLLGRLDCSSSHVDQRSFSNQQQQHLPRSPRHFS